MTTQGFDWWLSKSISPVEAKPGESGYFSSPTSTLDPRLFSGDQIRTEVRSWILRTLYDYWAPKYHQAKDWSTVWIAGSGISYQWSAGRGNGDLDVLIGIDYPLFFRFNDRYLGMSENDMADIINADLHTGLWPHTATTEINPTGSPIPGGVGANQFEVTFYNNPGTDESIRSIHPYAAYNLTKDRWDVRPPKVAQDPAQAFPQAYWDAVTEEKTFAHMLVSRYNQAVNEIQGSQSNSPGWHNAVRKAQILTAQAKSLFDDIHLGRKNAFGSGGSGYADYYNFRWQAHKKSGTVQALDAVAKAQEVAREQSDTGLYGGPVNSANVVLRQAALWNRGGHG